MKKSLFKILLHNFLIVIILNTAMFLLLMLMFYDAMKEMGNDMPLIIFLEIFGIVTFAILYQLSFFLPLFHLRKTKMESQSAYEIFETYCPVVTLIAGIPSLLMLLIAVGEGEIHSFVWINFWLILFISFSGMAGFAYNVKK